MGWAARDLAEKGYTPLLHARLVWLFVGALALVWVEYLAEGMSLNLLSPLLGQIIFALPVCSLALLLSCLLSEDSQHGATASGWKMSPRSS